MQQADMGTLWGLERVDAKGITSFVVSTPSAKDFYAKFGFVAISHVDLGIVNIRGNLLGFGFWRQYGMLRATMPANVNRPDTRLVFIGPVSLIELPCSGRGFRGRIKKEVDVLNWAWTGLG
jgi:hypothetical protein